MSTIDHRPTLPAPRGALSERIVDAPDAAELARVEADDAALTLWVLQELSYRGAA